MIANRQNQRCSVATKQNEAWYIPNIHYFINLAISNNDKTKTLDNLDAANGIVPDKTYKYVLNPIQFDNSVVKNLPGEIRDVDFINPIREKNIGEYLKLPNNYTVIVDDPDISLLRNKQVANEIAPILEQAVINLINSNNDNPNALQNQPQQLNQQGQGQPNQQQVQQQVQQQPQQQQSSLPNSGVPSVKIDDIKKTIEEVKDNWFDDRADRASKLIKWICNNNDSENKRLTLFNYWWGTEECYIYVYKENNDVLYEVISPLEGYPIDNGYEFTDDHDAFMIKRNLSLDRIYEYYSDDLTKTDIDYLNELLDSRDSTGRYTITAAVVQDIYGRKVFDDSGREVPRNTEVNITNDTMISEVIVFFKTQVKRKVLYKYNQLGNVTSEIIQDKDFQFNPELGHISVESEWITETWKQVLLGQEYVGIYLKPKPIDIQTYDAKGHNKLPIVGKKGLLNGIYINPIPKRIIPNLALYRIITLQIERQFAKYKGTMELIPKSLLLGDDGDVQGNMFYRLADGSMIWDDSNVNLQTAVQGYRMVGNDAATNYIKALFEFRDTIKSEAWDMANMNDSRNGDAPASATVSNNQQNIINARLGSALMVTTFNSILVRLYTQLLEYSKVTYVDGVSGSIFDRDNNKISYFNLHSNELSENQYGIYVSNAVIDLEKLNEYKKLAFSASQNGDFDIATAAIDSDNVSNIRKHIKELVKMNKEYAQRIEQEKMAQAAQIHTEQMQDKQADRNIKLAEIKLKEEMVTERDIKVASIKANATQQNNNLDVNNINK